MHEEEVNPCRQFMNAQARAMDRLFLQIAHDAVHDFLKDAAQMDPIMLAAYRETRAQFEEVQSLEQQWERS